MVNIFVKLNLDNDTIKIYLIGFGLLHCMCVNGGVAASVNSVLKLRSYRFDI